MPEAIAVIVPSFETVATFVLELIHSKSISVAFVGRIVAVRVNVSSVFIVNSVKSNKISVIKILTLVTVTVQVALLPPAVAVIVAVPAFNAVTLPFSTFATVLSELFQVTVLSVALVGATVVLSVSLPPTSRASVVLLKVILVTSITEGFSSG